MAYGSRKLTRAQKSSFNLEESDKYLEFKMRSIMGTKASDLKKIVQDCDLSYIYSDSFWQLKGSKFTLEE